MGYFISPGSTRQDTCQKKEKVPRGFRKLDSYLKFPAFHFLPVLHYQFSATAGRKLLEASLEEDEFLPVRSNTFVREQIVVLLLVLFSTKLLFLSTVFTSVSLYSVVNLTDQSLRKNNKQTYQTTEPRPRAEQNDGMTSPGTKR